MILTRKTENAVSVTFRVLSSVVITSQVRDFGGRPHLGPTHNFEVMLS
jgi:hypothetical protein